MGLLQRLVLALFVVSALPNALPAQIGYSLAPFASVDRSLPNDPLLLGAGAAIYYRNIGLRASGAAAFHEYQIRDQRSLYGNERLFALAGDVDATLKPGRRAGAAGAVGGLEPRLFAGIGIRSERFEGMSANTHTVASLGTTFSYSVFGRLRLEGEARRVVPLDRIKELAQGTNVGSWEFRAGFSLNFGKAALRPTPGIMDGLRIPGLPGATGAASGGGRMVVDVEPGTVLHTADSYVGKPYVWGGDTPDEGFDCSGFLKHVFERHDVPLPRTSREMYLIGDEVPGSVRAMKPGDLMFFAENGDGRITHVGMYVGENMMIHSSKSGGGVGYDDLTTRRGAWFQRIMVGGRRVLGVEIEAPQIGGSGAAASVPSRRGGGIAAFLAAAGLQDLSAVARQLYASHERPDPPDNAPRRRW